MHYLGQYWLFAIRIALFRIFIPSSNHPMEVKEMVGFGHCAHYVLKFAHPNECLFACLGVEGWISLLHFFWGVFSVAYITCVVFLDETYR